MIRDCLLQVWIAARWRYTQSAYGGRISRSSRSIGGDPAAVKVVQFNANDLGTEEKMDGQGRQLLTSEMREALGLEDNAQLHMQSRNGHIELITDPVYQELRARAQREAAAATEKLLGEGFE